ncbi:peptidyl-prolyl cis-trans isomerase [Congregibacter litoralis]|uniref:peptidylprolyl isomerase n=1 Tax=Congregibacter litoralis TaxID=393662 RepID=UPI001260247B|nr:peptidylprolyl isomerase [Congregibacter litoralis]
MKKARVASADTLTERSAGRGLFRDPLLHFVLLGLLLFFAYLSLNDQDSSNEDIVVSVAQQEQLIAAYTRVWRRPPKALELKGLLDDYIREEIANREALALGFAANDPVVRRRLRQKYESFMDQFAASVEPSEDELQQWYETRMTDYSEDARYSLRHRFFSSDRREDARGDAASALAGLAPADPEADPALGDALAMPQRYEDTRETELASRFGQGFTDSLSALPEGRWSGPVPSAYGYHLVFIESVRARAQPPLGAVRAAVLRDWRAEHVEKAREELYASLLDRYTVKIQTPAETSDS